MGLKHTRWLRRAATIGTTLAVAALGLTATALPAAAADGDPAIAVYLADGSTPYTGQPVTDGDTLVVKGTGFDPAANVGGHGVPIPATLPQGDYIAFGSFAPQWRPSTGAPSAARVSDSSAQVWALAQSVLDQVPAQYQGAIRAGWVPINDDGSFTATITIAPPANPPADGIWGIYSYAAGGVVNAAQELTVPVNYSAEANTPVTTTKPTAKPTKKPATKPTKKPATKPAAKPSKDPATTKPAAPQCRMEDVPAGLGTPRLDWAIKGSFLSYIDSSLADGAVTAGGGAAWNGSTVTWGAGSGTLNTSGQGILTFPGTLHITGHGGVLDVTFSHITVKITGSRTGVLQASAMSSDMNGKPVAASGAIADLAFTSLGQGGGTASATLTANGAKAFAGFYHPGDALDPVTISFAGSSPAKQVERCYDAAGNLVNRDGTSVAGLAETGVKAADLAAAGLILAAAGALLLTAARRRSVTA